MDPVDKNDALQVVVPKRTAMVLDKMMVALQRALDDDASLSASEAQPEQVKFIATLNFKQKNKYYKFFFIKCFLFIVNINI